MAKPRSYWLLKSEPDCFSLDDLAAAPKGTTCWDGVRNYQARNFMRDGMKQGDLALYYHSSCSPPGVVGIVEIVREAYPDHTAWDPRSDHFDAKASSDNPIWQMVDVRFVEKFPELVPLDRLREETKLAEMELLRRGSRLSVQPVRRAEFECVLAVARGSGSAAKRSTAVKQPAAPKKKQGAKKKATSAAKRT